MAASTALIAGRPVPSWIGHALWLLVMFAAFALTVRLENLQGAASSQPAPPVEGGMSPVEAAPRAAGPVMLQLDRPMRHGDYVWNDAGVPPGRVEILVDIGTQVLHVFRSGHEIGRAVILYGTDENPTPLGRFTITEKDVDHESNIYDAIMPYMMRLTNDGIAIHGAVVEYGKASRGCVGVPDEFAALLFAQARLGDQVRIIQSSAPVSTAS
jgi:hypothetical protein